MSDGKIHLIRESYNLLAEEYARQLFNELENKPLDRELLNRFAAEMTGRGQVCDMGCGPGHVTRYLRNAGVDVIGMDLSPRMLEQARRLNPDIWFQEGDMLALSFGDHTLAGISAFYAIVNIPEELLAHVFQEMERVLQPGGLVLLAFHAGDETVHVNELWGQSISMDFFYFRPSLIQRHLEAAGLFVEEILERGPYAPEVEHQSRRAYVFARKPVS